MPEEGAEVNDATKCPLGCDVPWPHPPGGCAAYLSAEDFDDFVANMTWDCEPAPTAIEANRLFYEMLDSTPKPPAGAPARTET